MYVLNSQVYNGNKLFRTKDGGNSWENISESLSNTTIQGLEISPHTGEVFMAGVNGAYVLLPPYESDNTTFERVKYPKTYISEIYTVDKEQTPFEGSKGAVPGKIECEEYDEGGQNISYNDDDEKTGDMTYRQNDNVDVEAIQEISNGYAVNCDNEGEWLEYTININAGIYDIVLSYSSVSTENGELQIVLDGVVLGCFININDSK